MQAVGTYHAHAGCMQVLRAFYLDLRAKSAGAGAPITTRQLEALVRLAEARARADLRQVWLARSLAA